MSFSKLPDPLWVDQMQDLADMVDYLMQQSIIAVDTESNSLYVYKEQVCLIQISSLTKDFLIDPLALDDLSSLGKLFASKSIQKVFHAAEYDLICLKRDFNFKIANIFDTMVAGRTLGYQSIGLAAMLERVFSVQVDKRYQRANWGQRPLKAEMIAYASQDSHYLIPLRDILIRKLEEQGRMALVEEDCMRLCTNAVASENHAAGIWRIRGASDLKPKQLSALRAVYDFRESIAMAANRPPFKVMSNQALMEVAQTLPKYTEELNLLPSLSKNQVQRYGKGLLQAVKSSKNTPPVPHKHNHRLDNAVLERRDDLSEWRKRAGRKIGVQSDVILPRDVMNQIADSNPKSLEELSVIMRDVPYRFEHYGKDILKVLQGEGRV
ncbi:MAG: ribonuclease D [Chloroflexota bacterium]